MRKIALLCTCLICCSILAIAAPAEEPTQERATVIQPQHFDMSPPLRDIPPVMVEQEQEEEPAPILWPRPEPVPGALDTAVQSTAGITEIPSPIANFAGLGVDFNGFPVRVAPPDTNMAVGPNHIVQIVNISFVVLDKTGNTLLPPRAINTLWSGFGGLCESHNNGDPIVQYDTLADRWVISQFALPANPPFSQCVAVSTSGDPTGSYFRYEYQYPSFIDYPKMSVWPDGYYVSYNLFGPASVGGEACVFDRVSMLSGLPATQQCFQPNPTVFSLLPADLDGPTPPPAGSPNYFVALGNAANTLSVWQFHVDWVTPANSTFTGPTNLATSPFTEVCTFFPRRACIQQLNTAQELETLSDRLMYRAAYRNFGDHESLVANHSIIANSTSGLRWYEVRIANGVPTLYQQGTYAPDASYRWMGSVAMNRVGDMALGFSLSGVALHPAIHYTGRLVTDPLGQISLSEGSIIDGTGSQGSLTSYLARWGDYSAMRIDPADDCTFWYTTEYIIADGVFNWSTRIGAFRFEPTQLQATAPANATAGIPFNITVTVQDACNNARRVHFSSSDPQAILPADSMLQNGTGTFSVTLKTAGSITVTAADAASPSVKGTATITVADAGANRYTLNVPPFAVAGGPFTLLVSALDVYNNLAKGYTGTVHFTSSDSQAVLPADSTLINGTKSFIGVTLKTAGPMTIAANDTVTPSINGSGTTTVTNAAASKYAFTLPPTVTAGTAFSTGLIVRDQFNNIAKTYVGTVHFTTSDPSGSVVLPTDYAFQPADQGQKTFSNFTLQTAGAQSITATDTQNNSITISSPTTVTGDAFLRPQARTIRMFRPIGLMIVASFTDDDVSEDGHHLTASIDWGDGTAPDTGIVVRVGTTNVFNVLGSHIYARTRGYNVKVTMTDSEGSIAIANSTARLFPRSSSY